MDEVSLPDWRMFSKQPLGYFYINAAFFYVFGHTVIPLKLVNDMPVAQLANKIVLDTNNYMPWRDGRYALVDTGAKTEHELRQDQLPTSKVAKAFTHIQAPRR